MADQGILLIVSGFSGAGKGTITKAICNKYDNYALSVSATTRQPRAGEIDGEHYFFRTREQFEDMIRRDDLIEYASYQGNYYGTPKEYVFRNLAEGKDVILEIEVQGAMKVHDRYPDTLMIFVTTPSAKILADRLRGRGTEDETQIRGRLRRAVEESELMNAYDYILVNDKLDDAVETLHQIVRTEHIKAQRMCQLIADIQNDLRKSVNGERGDIAL